MEVLSTYFVEKLKKSTKNLSDTDVFNRPEASRNLKVTSCHTFLSFWLDRLLESRASPQSRWERGIEGTEINN